MHPNAGVSAPSSALRIDIRRFSWINRLAADYAFDPDGLAPFFAGDVRHPDAWRSAIARAQTHPRQRAALVDLLTAQQARRGAPAPARDAAATLLDPSSVAVVTGQQAGLFGGPLYTVLKALSAVRLADTLRSTYGVPAVAVFWVDAEDHDWAEVNACGVLDGDVALRQVCLDHAPPAGRSIASVALGPGLDAALEAVAAALPPTEFTPQLLADLREAYGPGRGMADAFARWLEHLLGSRGLVVYDASDPAAKPLLADLFAREIEHVGRTSQLAADAGAQLQAAGYHAQVTPQLDAAAVFHTANGRTAMRATSGGIQVGDDVHPRDAMVQRARRHPEEFSPNVLLRPLAQDTLFPTVCYVGGPSEIAYFGQLRAVYDTFGVPMPLVQARASATILDANAAKFVSRDDVAFEHLRAQDEAALNALLAAALPASVETAVDDALRTTEERMAALAAAAGAVDATLEGATRSALGRMQDDVRKLHAKIVQAAKRKDDTLRRQFKHAQAQAFPSGQPQERVVSALPFLNKFGPTFIDRLADSLVDDPGVHLVITP